MLRERFKLRVYESDGTAYQSLFNKIMCYHDKSFKPVKPHGNIGDGGNDGYSAKFGKFFQVYAPEELPKNSKTSLAKAEKDLGKLIEKWGDIEEVKEFYFVVNDKFRGTGYHLTRLVKSLKSKYGLDHTEIVLASDLENILFNLPSDIIQTVLGQSEIESSQDDIYRSLIDAATTSLNLPNWINTSDNLTSCGISNKMIEGIGYFSRRVAFTEYPGTDVRLEDSIINLADRATRLATHFKFSEHAFRPEEGTFWIADKRWKKIRVSEKEYQQLYREYEKWEHRLDILHFNLVVALNEFGSAVRSRIIPGFFGGQNFTVVDSLGTFSEDMTSSYTLPRSYLEEE